jgi:WD40 repeat protein
MKLSLVVSPDGKLASVVDRENHVYMYSLEDGERIYGPLVGHDSRVTSARFNPDGVVLATGDADGKVVLWDVKTGTLIKRIRVLTEEGDNGDHTVTGLAFSPDGTQLLVGGDVKSVFFNIDTLALIRQFSSYDTDYILAYFSPDSTPIVLIKREDCYELWNAFTGEMIGVKVDTGFLDIICDEIFNPIQTRLITASGLSGNIGVLILTWDLNERLPFERLFLQDEEFRSVAYHPDPSRSLFATGSEGGGVFFWDSDTGEQIGETLQKDKAVYDLAFSPNGSLLATATNNGEIVIWDFESLEPIGAPLSGHEDIIYALEFNPDGTLLASAAVSDPVPLRIWALSQQPPISEVLGSDDEGPYNYDSLDFSPDGQMLAACSGDGVTIWDVPNRSLIDHLDKGMEKPARVAAIFSSDGRTLFTALTRGVRIWDYVNQEVLAEPQDLTMEPLAIEKIALSPDGQLLASALLYSKLALWNGYNGQILSTPIDLPASGTIGWGNNTIAFSPDGGQLAIVGDFGILLWDMRIESWMEAACRMANRDLTSMEWRTYLGDLPYQETCP